VFVGEGGLFTFAITEDTPAAIEEEDTAIFLVEQRIELPIAEPSEEAMASLFEGSEDLPWERNPWVLRHDYEIVVDWVLVNLDDAPHTITITMNGISEFHEYVPLFAIVDEELVADYAGWERTYRVEPLERRFGTIREEEFDEIAVDLATVVNGAPNANQIVYFQNQSAHDERSMRYIPRVIPALTGLRAGLRSTSPGNVVLELTVRVRDENDKIVPLDEAWELPVPVQFSPMPPAEE
jgi:hypothetical protein